ncbi:hypothetical protein O0L34_g14881 [Tuta absoluta]|nr:hypothetical protein O0L34_g14881 [Tuta absoluta]
MATTTSGPDPPLGITQLSELDRLLVRQKSYAGNKYEVMGPNGSVILHGRDDANAVGQLLGGTNRAFNIDVFDTQGKLVIKLRRPYTFGADKMEVFMSGKLASVVRQEMTFLKPVLIISDENDQPIFRVKGPVNSNGEGHFDVLNMEKKKVGVIRKKWGKTREVPADGDSFQLQLPADLHVRYKSAILGTCFLIDFLYYES